MSVPRTNHQLFTVEQTGCPTADRDNHIANLMGLQRLEFETVLPVANNLVRLAPNDEPAEPENKITSIQYATRKLGNHDDAIAFITALKQICGEDPDARSLQSTASHFYAEAKVRPVNLVLKEMAMLGGQLNALTAERENEIEMEVTSPKARRRNQPGNLRAYEP